MVKQTAQRLGGGLWRVVAVVAILGVAATTAYVLWSGSDPEPEQVALVDCAAEAPDDYDCWRDRLWTLVEEESPMAALDDARAANDSVPYFASSCHQFAHEIGRAAGHKYMDVAEAYEKGDDFCASGYFHGVMEAMAAELGKEELFATVDEICSSPKESNPYGLDHYNCAHGLGHGLMAVTYSELFESLDGCDGFTDGWEAESCHSGVFMENIMAKDNPHHSTEFLSDEEPLYPCTDVEEQYKRPCYLIQTSHALRVVGMDYAEVFDLCGSVEEQHHATCYQSLGRDVSGNTNNDVPRTLQKCGLGPDYDAELNCLIGAAKDYVYHFYDEDPGQELCAAIEDSSMSSTCRDEVASFYQGFGHT